MPASLAVLRSVRDSADRNVKAAVAATRSVRSTRYLLISTPQSFDLDGRSFVYHARRRDPEQMLQPLKVVYRTGVPLSSLGHAQRALNVPDNVCPIHLVWAARLRLIPAGHHIFWVVLHVKHPL